MTAAEKKALDIPAYKSLVLYVPEIYPDIIATDGVTKTVCRLNSDALGFQRALKGQFIEVPEHLFALRQKSIVSSSTDADSGEIILCLDLLDCRIYSDETPAQLSCPDPKTWRALTEIQMVNNYLKYVKHRRQREVANRIGMSAKKFPPIFNIFGTILIKRDNGKVVYKERTGIEDGFKIS